MLRVEIPATWEPERRFIAETLFREFVRLPASIGTGAGALTCIRMAGAADGREVTVAEGLFRTSQDSWLQPSSVPGGAVMRPIPEALRWVGGPSHLPDFFSGAGHPVVECEGEGHHVTLDLFGTAFLLLSRYEEVAAPARDRHGRHPAAATLSGRLGLIVRPVVNELAEFLANLLRSVWPSLVRGERTYRLLPTHDVDHPLWVAGRSPVSVLAQVGGDLARRRTALAARRWKSWRRTRADGAAADPYNTFAWLMRESESAGVRSAFYFLTAVTDPRYDPGYRIEAPFLLGLLREIARHGHEIGLHASYGAGPRPEVLAAERTRLAGAIATAGVPESAVWGGRHHYLRWTADGGWAAWDRAGFGYDSSVGFAEVPGFRTGACQEHPTFDLRARRPLRLRARPLTVMDVSLTAPDYLGLAPDAALEHAKDLTDLCRRYRGDCVLLWHNNGFAEESSRQLYRGLLQAARP